MLQAIARSIAGMAGMAGITAFALMIGQATASEGTITVAPSSAAVQMDRAGEISLAVVPPGKNRFCRGGRVLIANDEHGPAWGPTRRLDGIVTGIDLATGTTTPSLFNEPPNPLDYQHNWSSDKNMVSLPNGEVIYQAPSFSRRPVTASDADTTWFDSTFHFNGSTLEPDFGPGARTVLTIWRSRNCGNTFEYEGEADPSAFGNKGECAYPQPPVRKDLTGTIRSSMGGTDGPWLGVDRNTGALLLTHGCVGNFPMATAPSAKCPAPLLPLAVKDFNIGSQDEGSPFILSNCPLLKTYVLTSTNAGKDWTTLGVIDASWWMWRAMAVPLPQGKLAVGWNGTVYLGTPAGNGKLGFKPLPGPDIAADYNSNLLPNASIGELQLEDPRPTLLSRVPGAANKVFLLVPSTVDIPNAVKAPQSTHGYKVFVVDTATGTWSEPSSILSNILPKTRTKDNLIHHLTRVDIGEGPVLFYWYDVSADTGKAVIRGRVYYSENTMTDFVISKKDDQEDAFDLLTPDGDAYSSRHYKMAEGFRQTSKGFLPLKSTYEYFPTWVQPEDGGTAHFSRVTISVPSFFFDKVKVGGATQGLTKVTLQVRKVSPLAKLPSLSEEYLRFLERHETERGPH
jgi:hypothetical protein